MIRLFSPCNAIIAAMIYGYHPGYHELRAAETTSRNRALTFIHDKIPRVRMLRISVASSSNLTWQPMSTLRLFI